MNKRLKKTVTKILPFILIIPFEANAFVLGIGVHPTGFKENTEYYINMAENYGFRSFRADMQWQRVENKKSLYSINRVLQKNDKLFQTYSHASSSSTLLILNYGNKYYTPKGYPSDDQEIHAFTNYVDWLSKRYVGKVKYYEVWNEWLQGTGVQQSSLPSDNPAIYTKLVKESYIRIKKNDENAIVMIGSINPTIPKYINWANGLIEQGILEYCDAISIHAYSTRISKPNTKDPEQAISEIDKFESSIRNKTGKSKPIYITEMGYPTMARDHNLSEYNVAEKILKFTLMARSREYIKGIWWYDLIDHTSNRFNPEDNYGFFYFNEQPKLSSIYLQKLSGLLTDDSVKFSQTKINGIITITITDLNNRKIRLSWYEGKPIGSNNIKKFLLQL
ncbi:cellulase family glycosylhydrolase [Klebsiella oxytoca]|uniref:cellulase family glycosylhydrolase n=1 Tax=Klebsiella oxytoca TaxID=571 RepID=UPI0039C94984|nr:hypothetical protein [Klebsiella oxytoca]